MELALVQTASPTDRDAKQNLILSLGEIAPSRYSEDTPVRRWKKIGKF